MALHGPCAFTHHHACSLARVPGAQAKAWLAPLVLSEPLLFWQQWVLLPAALGVYIHSPAEHGWAARCVGPLRV